MTDAVGMTDVGGHPDTATASAPEAKADALSAADSARKDVVVLDYGVGNVHSVLRAIEEAGAHAQLSADPQKVLATDGLIVPGVGAFQAVMQAFKGVDGPRLIGRRVAGGRAVLGICVGMQILFEEGIEHGVTTRGMGEWPGVVDRLHAPVVPHMGWDTVQPAPGSTLFRGIEDERFYFVHSYAVQRWDFDQTHDAITPPLVAWSEYGDRFVAAVENGPLCATQFHPEKSGEAGIALLRNWLGTL